MVKREDVIREVLLNKGIPHDLHDHIIEYSRNIKIIEGSFLD